MLLKPLIALAGAGSLLAACTDHPHTEHNAAGGAAIGALAGAVIGNNVGGGTPGTGAAIGAAVGGSAGAVKGCREHGGCGAACAQPPPVLRRTRRPVLLLRPPPADITGKTAARVEAGRSRRVLKPAKGGPAAALCHAREGLKR